jgi:hypothetical protein
MNGPFAARMLTAYSLLKREGFDPGVPRETLEEWRRIRDAWKIEYERDMQQLALEQEQAQKQRL